MKKLLKFPTWVKSESLCAGFSLQERFVTDKVTVKTQIFVVFARLPLTPPFRFVSPPWMNIKRVDRIISTVRSTLVVLCNQPVVLASKD